MSCRAGTETSPDPEAVQPTKDVLVLLAPMLPPQPGSKSLLLPKVHVEKEAVTATSEAAPKLSSPTHCEGAAVLDFIQQQSVNSGLFEVSAALLESLLSQPGHPVTEVAIEDLLQLETLVRGNLAKQANYILPQALFTVSH